MHLGTVIDLAFYWASIGCKTEGNGEQFDGAGEITKPHIVIYILLDIFHKTSQIEKAHLIDMSCSKIEKKLAISFALKIAYIFLK